MLREMEKALKSGSISRWKYGIEYSRKGVYNSNKTKSNFKKKTIETFFLSTGKNIRPRSATRSLIAVAS